jgi:transcriptional regulator with XRE-family HTH domain
MKITQIFGNRVREIRQELDISQEELSYRAGLHRTYISSIELGKRNLSLINIEKLSKALECEIIDFFTNKRTKHGRK